MCVCVCVCEREKEGWSMGENRCGRGRACNTVIQKEDEKAEREIERCKNRIVIIYLIYIYILG